MTNFIKYVGFLYMPKVSLLEFLIILTSAEKIIFISIFKGKLMEFSWSDSEDDGICL